MRDFFVFRTSLPWWPVIAAAAVGTGAALRLLPQITPANFAMIWVFTVGLALAVNIGKFAARYEVPMSAGLGNSVAALAVSRSASVNAVRSVRARSASISLPTPPGRTRLRPKRLPQIAGSVT